MQTVQFRFVETRRSEESKCQKSFQRKILHVLVLLGTGKWAGWFKKDEKQHKKIHFRRAGFVTIKFPSHNVNSKPRLWDKHKCGFRYIINCNFCLFYITRGSRRFLYLTRKKIIGFSWDKLKIHLSDLINHRINYLTTSMPQNLPNFYLRNFKGSLCLLYWSHFEIANLCQLPYINEGSEWG